jgi:hypothetical protein
VVAQALAGLPEYRQVPAASIGDAVAPFVSRDGVFRTHPARDGLDGYFGVVLERGPAPLAPRQVHVIQ